MAATAFAGAPCCCHDLGADGIGDLVMHFATSETVRELELDSADRGDEIELIVRGHLFDGTEFEASDCITIVSGRHRAVPRNQREPT